MNSIKMFIMDVDGTLTDGRIILGSDGTEYKNFNVKDGMGIKILQEYGVVPVIITGRNSKIVVNRCKELGIQELHQGIVDKRSVLMKLAEKYDITLNEIAYIGDDINDFEAMRLCGRRFAVGDAVSSIKKIATDVMALNGGNGAVREAVDILLD